MLQAIFFIVNLIFAIIFWKNADLAWENGRTGDAYVQLFFSALCGSLVLGEVF